jgi:hypothetical protein
MGYQGSATIITGDGTELSTDVSLAVRRSGHLESWEGHGSLAAEDAMRLITELGNQRLRLPNGNEASIVVSHASGPSSATRAVVRIVGSGPPPF